MNIQNLDKWNLLSYAKPIQHNEMQRVSEHLKAKYNTEEVDTVTFSKEGLEALHGQQLSGAVDVEELKRMHEVLPKLNVNPEDEFYWAMREDMSNALNAIKEEKGDYTLDDLLSIRMNAYANQYDTLLQSYENGIRDIYVCNGTDENGKFLFHKVTMEDDIKYLDAAFSRIADSMIYSMNGKENVIEIRENFGGEQIDIDLPENYEEKMMNIMNKAVSNINTRSHLLATYNETRLDVNAMKQQIYEHTPNYTEKTDAFYMSPEGKSALEQKMMECRDNTIPHIEGNLSDISKQYYVDAFGEKIKSFEKSKDMDAFLAKMNTLYEDMQKEIEEKYENSNPLDTYFVSDKGDIEILTKDKEFELLKFAYNSHKILIENSMKI